MKKKSSVFYYLLVCLFAAAGCTGIKKEGPVLKNPAPKITKAQDKLKKEKKSFTAPKTLGGIVASDSWVLYPEKEQEEFKGNVSYDNGVYSFRADYALSDRSRNTFSASGNVYLKQAPKDGPVYEARAEKGSYNYQTGQGNLQAGAGQFIHLTYMDTQGIVTKSQARKADFDINSQTYNLYNDVTVTRPTQYGQATVTADKISVRQADEYALLQGNARVATPQHSVTAQTIEIDGKNNRSYAYGSRVLAQGKLEEGVFAVIADKAEAENETRKIHLQGNVSGWLVSDQINQAEINDKF